MKKRIVIITVIFTFFAIIGLVQDLNLPISSTNINKLTQTQSFDGECGVFSHDGTSIATAAGVFDLSSGEQRINSEISDLSYAPTSYPFSPDDKWIVTEDSIYEVETGDQVLTLPTPQVFVIFSENVNLAHINGRTYDTATWELSNSTSISDFDFFVDREGKRYVWRDITSGNGMPTYLSSRGEYWVYVLEGIYDVLTGELIELPEELNNPAKLESGVFSPDDSLFFIRDDGVYATPTFEKLYDFVPEVGHRGRNFTPFSPNNDYFAIRDDAIYEARTGKLLISITGRAVFSHNNQWAGTSDGLYKLATDEFIHELGSVSLFSPDDTLVIVDQLYVFDTASGEKRFDLEDVSWRDLYFNADGSLLYGVSVGNELLIYDTANGNLLQTLPATASILSTNERFLGLTTDSNCQIYTIEN